MYFICKRLGPTIIAAGSMKIRPQVITLWLGSLFFLSPASPVRALESVPPGPSSTMDSVTTQPMPMSSEAQDFLVHPVDRKAFAQGLALVKSHKDSAKSRKYILDKLHGSRKTMDPAQLRALRDEATALAKDPQEPPSLSAQAIGAMASANQLLLERGAISPEEAKQEAPFLVNVAQDPAKDREMRGRAIRAIADLKVTEAVPVLQQLLADPANHNLPEVARNCCIALGRLSPDKALPAIVNVMNRTTDRSVFGSGAFALGHIKTAESMAALTQLKQRFPDSDSCEAALSEMEEVILDVLRNPQDPHLGEAIQATRHLWKKSQQEQYVPLLHGLLRSAPPPARAQALEELLNAAGTLDFAGENRELESLLALIADQKDLSGYAERIRHRLAAQPLTPTGLTIPVPSDAKVD